MTPITREDRERWKSPLLMSLVAALDAADAVADTLKPLVSEWLLFDTQVHSLPAHAVYATVGLHKITAGQMRSMVDALVAYRALVEP